jgi:hypothetical protein
MHYVFKALPRRCQSVEALVSPSQKAIWHPPQAIQCRIGICSRLLGAKAGKADDMPTGSPRRRRSMRATLARADLEGCGGAGAEDGLHAMVEGGACGKRLTVWI